jgi:maltose-binding protein MalE
MFYNRDLVTTPPATWNELKAEATDLQASGKTELGYCLQKGDPYHTYPLLTGFGGYVFGGQPDGSLNPHDIGIDSVGGLESAVELDAMVKSGLIRNDVDYGKCIELMTTGRTAFWITGPWALNDVRNSGVNYGVAPIPDMLGRPRPFVDAQGLMISSFSPNRVVATAFVDEYVLTDDVMAKLFDADGRLPVWRPTADALTDNDLAVFTAVMKTGDPTPAIPEMDSVWSPWTAAINSIFEQAGDPADLFRQAGTEIRNLIGD